MIKARIDADLYHHCVWPACASATPEGFQDLRKSMKLLGILEAKGTKISKDDGGGFKLDSGEATFEFNGEMSRHLLKKLELFLPRMQTWAAVKMLPLVDLLEEQAKKEAPPKR